MSMAEAGGGEAAPVLLAIVIPAWRAKYLAEAIGSLRAQTDRRFRLYVGDDGSPDDLEPIVREAGAGLDLVYRRFEDNLGGRDLVGHWNRCLAMTAEEPWIWLFADDDIADAGCVAAIYEGVAASRPETGLLRFNMRVIDDNGVVVEEPAPHPEFETGRELLLAMLPKKMNAERRKFCAPDHVFSREAWLAGGGIPNFPKALFSDLAAWLAFGQAGGVRTLGGAGVCWRKHSAGTSSGMRDAHRWDWVAAFAGYAIRLRETTGRLYPELLGEVESELRDWAIMTYRYALRQPARWSETVRFIGLLRPAFGRPAGAWRRLVATVFFWALRIRKQAAERGLRAWLATGRGGQPLVDFPRWKRGLGRRLRRWMPLRSVGMAELAAANPDCWREVYPEWVASWPERLSGGAVPEAFRTRLPDRVYPAAGVIRLRGARVVGKNGWVLVSDGRILLETAFHRTAPEHLPDFERPLTRRGATRLGGRTLSLLSDWAAGNFYHMLCEALPRAGMVLQAGWRWEDFDRILLPAFSSPTTERLLARLDVPEAKVTRVGDDPGLHLWCEELVCTSFPGALRVVPPSTAEFFRGLGAGASASGGSGMRLFVRRRAGTRRLRNEDRLAELAMSRGFVVLGPEEMDEPEGVFAAADVVVGAHGAALANLVFCRRGTRVLELLPSDQAYPFYFTLSVSAGLRYDCLIGSSDGETPDRHPMAPFVSPHDFIIDEEVFLIALDRLLSAGNGGFK